MTDNKRLILDFIDKNLEYGDLARVAKTIGVDRRTVSAVKNGNASSKRVLAALEAQAIKNKKHAIEITEFNKQATL